MKIAALLLPLAPWIAGPQQTALRPAIRPDTTQANPWYPSNRAPLATSPYVKLPVGAVRPQGWLRTQLELQNAGFHGNLAAISAFLKKEGNAWLSPTGEGEHGWEEVPYWLKGFGDCAYLLGDEGHIAEAREWIEAALASQREDGFFGPRGKGAQSTVSSTEGEWDLWPNMVMLDVLRSWYEYKGDARVLELMARYFRWELRLPDEKFLPPYWQHLRGYDNLWSVFWLYDRTEDAALAHDLLALAQKIFRCAARWEEGVIDWHNVNLCQGFGGPTFYSMLSGDERHRGTAERNFQEFRAKYGQVPGGLFGADEVARAGYGDPRQAVETCGMVEFMYSCERLILATGATVWADRCEDVAFNSLPAAFTAGMRALRYLTAPNMAAADRTSHNPGIMNGGPMFCFDPNDHRCCQHNAGHGWPYLAEHLWLATADAGLCLMFPLASSVSARVGRDGREVKIECETDYPFSARVRCTLRCPEPTRFPLYLRVPGWSEWVSLEVAGEQLATEDLSPGELVRLEREWRDGESVSMTLLSQPKVRRWPGNHDSASIDWGPLTYALDIPSETLRSGGSDTWPAYEILPRGPWNYALVLPPKGEPLRVGQDGRRITHGQPLWSPEAVPLRIHIDARRVPAWQLDEWQLVAPLQQSPVKTEEPVESVTLIPMGAARIRISAFPVAGAGPDATEWIAPPQPPHPSWRMSASYCYEPDTVMACIDGREPASSDDHSLPRQTFWPHKGTSEWIQCEFEAPRRVAASAVYWFDDSDGGGCSVPARWKLLYQDPESGWHELPARYDEPTRDGWCRAEFEPLEARALRLEVELRPGRSGGVLEWHIE